MTIQFKLSPRWLFVNGTELGGEVTFGPATRAHVMIERLLALHRKRDEARSAPRTANPVIAA